MWLSAKKKKLPFFYTIFLRTCWSVNGGFCACVTNPQVNLAALQILHRGACHCSEWEITGRFPLECFWDIYTNTHTYTCCCCSAMCVCVSDVLWVCHFAVIPPCLCTKTRSKPLVRKGKSSGGFWELLRWQIMWLSVNWTEMGLIYIPPPSQTGSVFVWHYFCLCWLFFCFSIFLTCNAKTG